VLPLKKIIWPTDFSDPSYKALKAADELAAHFSAELLIVHVLSPIPVLPSPEATPSFNVALYLQEMEAAAKKSLDELIQSQVTNQQAVRTMVVEGHPADQIVRIAADEGADMIVIATHGRTGLHHLVFGSVAERVVRFAHCPVLTVHLPPEKKE
jgi:nucleotide-binding universal stress UspA family protein